jgi:phage recombination protein Bet
MTSMEMDLTPTSNELMSTRLDASQIDLIKDTIAKGASDNELALFVEVCDRTGLNPFAKQIYLIERYDSVLGRKIRTPQTSIDGFRLIAQRSHEYAGQTPKYWCGQDGQWTDVWLSSEPPAAAKVGVYRQGFVEPLWAVATWDQYAVWNKSKDGKFYLGSMWKKMPALMLAKCAETLALRAAFPQELSGLYTAEEMGQSTNDAPPRAESQRGKSSRAGRTTQTTSTTRVGPPDVDGVAHLASDEQLQRISDALNKLSPDERQKFRDYRTSLEIPPPSRELSKDDAERVYSAIIAFLDSADAVDAEIVSNDAESHDDATKHDDDAATNGANSGASGATSKKSANDDERKITKAMFGKLHGLARDIRGYESTEDCNLFFSAVLKRPVELATMSMADGKKLIDQLLADKDAIAKGGATPNYGDRPDESTKNASYDFDEEPY